MAETSARAQRGGAGARWARASGISTFMPAVVGYESTSGVYSTAQARHMTLLRVR